MWFRVYNNQIANFDLLQFCLNGLTVWFIYDVTDGQTFVLIVFILMFSIDIDDFGLPLMQVVKKVINLTSMKI